MTRGGTCLRIGYENGSGPNGVFQPLENCDANPVIIPTSCQSNLNFASATPGFIRQKTAPFSANGEDTLLFGLPGGTLNPAEYELDKMLPGHCGGGTSHSTSNRITLPVSNVRDHAPAQVGNHAALFYVTTTNELRVFVQ